MEVRVVCVSLFYQCERSQCQPSLLYLWCACRPSRDWTEASLGAEYAETKAWALHMYAAPPSQATLCRSDLHAISCSQPTSLALSSYPVSL